MDVGKRAGEQRPDIHHTGCRDVRGNGSLGACHEVGDSPPVADGHLHADERHDRVQTVVRGKAARHLVMRLRQSTGLFEAASREAVIDAEEVDQCDVIGVVQVRHHIEAPLVRAKRLGVVPAGGGRDGAGTQSP